MTKTKVDLTNPIYHDNDAAREHLESLLWPDGPYCPRRVVVVCKIGGISPDRQR